MDITEYGEAYCRFLNPIEDEDKVEDDSEAAEDVCINDDSAGDTDGDTCSGYYDANPSSCGSYDTEEFIAAEMCCVCGGGNIIEGVYDPYKICLDKYPKLEDVSKKYSCDILNSTYDQYDYRQYCWPSTC